MGSTWTCGKVHSKLSPILSPWFQEERNLSSSIPAPDFPETPVRMAKLCIASEMSLKGWEWSEGGRAIWEEVREPSQL